MSIEKCKNKIDLLEKLHENGYDKLTTFLTYPEFDEDNIHDRKGNINVPGKYLELKDSYIYENKEKNIYSEEFLNDINIDNGMVFIGLNAATRDTQFNENHSVFQTMHDANVNHRKHNKTNDNFIAYSVHKTKAYGSFAFDIIDNFPKNEISDTTIKHLSENIEKTEFSQTDEIKDLNHMEKSDDLMNNFKKYYVPAFISIIKMIQPTKLICFGENATKLTKSIVKSTKINDCLSKNFKIIEVVHYAAQGSKGSYKYKKDEIEKAIK
ncbi:hypothetical protein [Apilactobacillus xinyiensis]|uniref:hypothetical protein n=1 Tax=Apilactobacillus xinyiensis TaxID=2841032 RepID=UPI00201087F1|nr:hypothetical protein [Apilactobacillus xinyiensis]MCL0330559.1 hypothetical protein [Apilactobacillus xinyiensis]